MSFPFLHLRGAPYEQGFRHGRELRDRVAHNIEVYFGRFAAEGRLSRETVLTRAGAYARAIGERDPEYHEALRGLAEGSGFDLDVVAALNVRYEILYHQIHVNAEVEGCTSFAVLPAASRNGHLWVGQNWDWIPEVKGAVVRFDWPGAPAAIGFTEAGIVGTKIGFNAAGIGLAVNGLATTGDDWARLRRPFHVRCHAILRSASFEEAAAVVTGEERSCSSNFLIAQAPGTAADFEAAPEEVARLQPEAGRLVHANHFVEPKALGVAEPRTGNRPRSGHRHDRLRGLLDSRGSLGLEDLQEFLRDHLGHPYSVCRHVDPDGPPNLSFIRRVSLTSAIMDLRERALWISDGPPCSNPYERFGLGDASDG